MSAARTALITGGTQGIGLEIAAALAARGVRVILHGLADGQAQAAAAVRLPDATLLAGDLARPEAVVQLIRDLAQQKVEPDILVHSASVESRRPLLGFDRHEAERQMAVNLWAGVELFAAVLPGMMDRGWGRLVAIGSVQQAKPHPDMLAYAASKAALANAVRNIARQVAGRGVTANVIAPGAILTGRTQAVLADEDYAARVLGGIPVGRFGTPQDIAGTALLLVGDEGAYINGQTIFVDGLMSF